MFFNEHWLQVLGKVIQRAVGPESIVFQPPSFNKKPAVLISVLEN